VSVGVKAQKDYGKNFIWVLAGIPTVTQNAPFEYYVIPSSIVSENVIKAHKEWLKTPGKKGQKHNESKVRTIHLPPHKSFTGWRIDEYKNRWDIIEALLA